MDIKTRIDELSEAEAKAALVKTIRNEALFRRSFPPRIVWYPLSPLYDIHEQNCLEQELLDEALKEARK